MAKEIVQLIINHKKIMTLVLFYDTETTGLPDFKAPSEARHQPHIVQLAACLVDINTRNTISSMDVIIKPEGWEIPSDVSEIHGITTEHAISVGVTEELALKMFIELWHGRTRIAHNESFDARIIRIAQHRFGHMYSKSDMELWKSGATECTQVLATPICKIPPTEKMKSSGKKHYKSAKLGEAYRHFLQKDLDNAHSAMADVKACMAVYFAIQDLKTGDHHDL